MEIIGAAALIAVGIVLAAVVYGRMHGPRAAPAGGPAATAPVVEVVGGRDPISVRRDADVLERTAAVARREEALASKEAALETARTELAQARRDVERELEQISGLSAGRAKQLLLKEMEEQAKHDAARRIRQIEEETKREAERRVRNILSVCMQRLAAGHAAETTV
ncbi:MAG: Rnase Y domain-containing protein, partial [Solirubrobacteraceae bacterium]